MIKEVLGIVIILQNMTFTLVVAMIVWGLIMSVFIDFQKKTEEIYLTVIKYAFITSIFMLILSMVLKSTL